MLQGTTLRGVRLPRSRTCRKRDGNDQRTYEIPEPESNRPLTFFFWVDVRRSGIFARAIPDMPFLDNGITEPRRAKISARRLASSSSSSHTPHARGRLVDLTRASVASGLSPLGDHWTSAPSSTETALVFLCTSKLLSYIVRNNRFKKKWRQITSYTAGTLGEIHGNNNCIKLVGG